MHWCAILRNNKKARISDLIIKQNDPQTEEDESVYLFSCYSKLKNLKVFTNPESDIIGFQCFSMFGKPITNLLEIDRETIPGYTIEKNRIEILGSIVTF